MPPIGYEYLHACGLDVVDMHKNIGAAVIGRDKAISAICVEEFDPPTWHAQLIRSRRTAPRPAPKESNGDGPGLGTRAEVVRH